MKVLIATSSTGFDPTEVAIPWKMLNAAGIDVHFATSTGEVGAADDHLVTGKDFGIVRKLLIARKDAQEAYAEMLETVPFQNPVAFDDIKVDDFDGLILPGGLGEGIRLALESETLGVAIAGFFAANKPVGAIAQGVLAVANTLNKETEKSLLHGRKVTALLQRQEMSAYNLTKHVVDDHFLVYPTTVESLVRDKLADPADFQIGKTTMRRDSMRKLKRGFAVTDGNLITARWPGDAYNFATGFLALIQAKT